LDLPTETISDEDRVLRRARLNNPLKPDSPVWIKPDNTASSFIFKKRKEESGVSVDLERLTT